MTGITIGSQLVPDETLGYVGEVIAMGYEVNWIRTMGLAGAAPLALALAAPSAVGANVEARCGQLGSTCVCSEPLNFSLAPSTPQNVDPPDSEGAGAKECTDGFFVRQIFGANNSLATLSTVPGSTVGLPQVENVFRKQGGNSVIYVDDNREFSSSTWCARFYWSVSGDANPPAVYGQDDLKFFTHEADDAWSATQAGQWWPNGRMETYPPGGTSWTWPTGHLTGTGDAVELADCSGGKWCRFERCFDHNWDGSGHLQFRARFTALSTGEIENYGPRQTTNSGPAAFTGNRRTFINNSKCDYVGCPSYQYLSHAIVAIQSPADPNFWIGPASEIEGGAAPPASAPAAPILLDQ